jgi:hypothetical protein
MVISIYNIDLKHLQGNNTISNLISFRSNSVKVVILANTSSNVTFILKRVIKQLKDPNIREAPLVAVRLINGVVTHLTQVLRVGL